MRAAPMQGDMRNSHAASGSAALGDFAIGGYATGRSSNCQSERKIWVNLSIKAEICPSCRPSVWNADSWVTIEGDEPRACCTRASQQGVNLGQTRPHTCTRLTNMLLAVTRGSRMLFVQN